MAERTAQPMRKATDRDLPQIVELCGEALGWQAGDQNQEFFLWKHRLNPFGPSPIWVAESDEQGEQRLVGVRAMMRWQLQTSDGARLNLVRAVDTATAPSHQGKGIFTQLTMSAVTNLTAESTDAVFNTPNAQSRPGYIKMGWRVLGRVPVGVRPRSWRAMVSMVRSRTAAAKWGIETQVGHHPAEAFADTTALDALCAAAGPSSGWHTPLSAEYLQWRTSFEPLGCRVQLLGSTIDDGIVVFRLRNRGAMTQLSVLHAIRPPDGPTLGGALGSLLRATGADVAMLTGADAGRATGTIPLPRSGPILTWRTLANPIVPDFADLDVDLGSTELF